MTIKSGLLRSLLLLICAGVSLTFWLLVGFLFDSPGSEDDLLVWALAVGLCSLAPLCLLGSVLPWLFRRWSWAGWLFGLPLAGVGLTVVAVVILAVGCGGVFACS